VPTLSLPPSPKSKHTQPTPNLQNNAHSKAKGIEFLVCDALYEARDILGLPEAAADVDAFLALDDRVLALVEALRPDDTEHPAAARRVRLGWRHRGKHALVCCCCGQVSVSVFFLRLLHASIGWGAVPILHPK
jgi:hypothetical protein